jgi:hypothetical protein
MPLVDTVLSFGVAKASRFGLLQLSDYANQSDGYFSKGSQGDGPDIAVWSKLLSCVFVARERAALQHPRQIFFNLAVVRASSAMNGSLNAGRDASLSTAAGFAAFGGDAAS